MKAKEYYEQLKLCTTEEEFKTKISDIMESFANDVDTLVVKRPAKTTESIRSVVSEVNNKWHALVTLFRKNSTEMFGYTLNDDGFYLCLCETRPKYKMYFEKKVNTAMKTIEDRENKAAEQAERVSHISLHKVIPLDEITEENITSEILQILWSMGNNFSAGMPVEWMRPLAYRVKFLEYWKRHGIDKTEIEKFESDNSGFLSAVDSLI